MKKDFLKTASKSKIISIGYFRRGRFRDRFQQSVRKENGWVTSKTVGKIYIFSCQLYSLTILAVLHLSKLTAISF